MENYTIYLPLYDEVSSHFKNFVHEMSISSYLSNYLVRYNRDRLIFTPTVTTVGEEILKKASIPQKALKPVTGKLNEKNLSAFATKFNMLASMTASRLGNKASFHMELTTMPDEFKHSTNVLVVTLMTKDLALSMTIDNLFKLLE